MGFNSGFKGLNYQLDHLHVKFPVELNL